MPDLPEITAHRQARQLKGECEWCFPVEPAAGRRATWIMFAVVETTPHHWHQIVETAWLLCNLHFWCPVADLPPPPPAPSACPWCGERHG